MVEKLDLREAHARGKRSWVAVGTDLNRDSASSRSKEVAIEPSTTTLLRLFYPYFEPLTSLLTI